MAKKATLLKRALKLKLDVTEKSTVPEIQAKLDAHAAKNTTKKATSSTANKPEAPKAPTEPVQAETAVESASEPQITLKDIIMLYNSVKPSRRRWIQNRNELRNRWKELFQLLERASGRDGQKVALYDYNFHKLIQKDDIQGLTNLDASEVTIVSDGGQAVADTTDKDQKIKELEALVETLHDQIDNQVNDTQAQLEAAEIATNGHAKGTW